MGNYCKIHRLTNHGIGITFIGGEKVLVPGSLPGEELEIVRFKRKYRRDIARISKIISPSKLRSNPDCHRFPSCPGCQLRHLSLASQQSFILDRLRSALQKIEKTRKTETLPVHFSSIRPNRYRIRTTVRPLLKQNRLVLGMPSQFSDESPVDRSKCLNHHPDLNTLISQIECQLSKSKDVSRLLKRIIQIETHLSDEGTHRVVVKTLSEPSNDIDLEKSLSSCFRALDISLYHLSLPSIKTIARFKMPRLVFGKPTITFNVLDREFSLLPTVWTPVAKGSTEKLIAQLCHWIKDKNNDSILEVGCGGGLISKSLLKLTERFMGIDINRWAIENARDNVSCPGTKSLEFRVGNANQMIRKLAADRNSYNTVVIHGMREPYGTTFLDQMALMNANQIILISPSINSWLKDCECLIGNGWNLIEIAVFDQIPDTSGFLIAGNLRKRINQG